MKQCPHCKRKFNFVSFLLKCGSDSLAPHSPRFHPREHLCAGCHRMFWIEYNPERLRRATEASVPIFLGVVVLYTIAISVLFALPPAHALGFGIVGLVFIYPIYLGYAKYSIAELRPER